MWNCPKCHRIFDKEHQPHSCHSVPLDQHFQNKAKAKELFDNLVKTINHKIGTSKIISLPCCIHLYGHYDFLAALPKKESLEIRFNLPHKLNSPRLIQSVPVSSLYVKNCIEISDPKDIDAKLINWLNESYHLKDKS